MTCTAALQSLGMELQYKEPRNLFGGSDGGSDRGRVGWWVEMRGRG
jgi:hypothetical protein